MNFFGATRGPEMSLGAAAPLAPVEPPLIGGKTGCLGENWGGPPAPASYLAWSLMTLLFQPVSFFRLNI